MVQECTGPVSGKVVGENFSLEPDYKPCPLTF